MNSTMHDFEGIYKENYKRVYSFLYRLCRDENVAEDLTQDTFYQAYISLDRYNGQCEMFTWLAAIVKNVFFNYLRRTKKESLVVDVYVSEPEAPLSDEPGYRILREVDIKSVRRAIRKLPKKYSEVLILRVYGELPFDEIAKKLDISTNSAKVIFYRAKNYIKEALENEEL
ncbi:MAG: RNA polymerase sigma factor [Firmicutes bacterium]|nr:RNA polymerase sigma factor [Bacillota bacterium]